MFSPTSRSTRRDSPSPRRRSCNQKSNEEEEKSMAITRTFVALVVAAAVAVIASAGLRAQAGAAAVTFKLGTFEQGGRTFVGLVLRDAQIVDIARANTAYEAANASAQKLTAPADMKQLITRYDGEWRARLMAIARTVPATGAPAYVYAVSA